MAKSKKTGGDYEVGRGKPPVHSRFKPGQCGNPGGRKRGSLNLKTIMQVIAATELEMSENGCKRIVPAVEAVLLRVLQQALKGDMRAAESFLNRYERHCDQFDDQNEELGEEDAAMLEEGLRRLLPPRRFSGQEDRQ